jgi:hypothetical protein
MRNLYIRPEILTKVKCGEGGRGWIFHEDVTVSMPQWARDIPIHRPERHCITIYGSLHTEIHNSYI